VLAALDSGKPLTLIGEAVLRVVSLPSRKSGYRLQGAQGPRGAFRGDKAKMVNDLRQALYAAKIVSTRRATNSCVLRRRSTSGT